MGMIEVTRKMKSDSYKMASLSIETRNNILKNVREALIKNQQDIFEANKTDMENAEKNNIADSVKKRLKFDEHKLSDVTNGIQQLISLPDPINKIVFQRELDENLILKRISCPIGVIGIIFEARPDALVQISSLCIKSGNCAVLKGGKETANTNKALFNIIYKTAVESGAPEGCMFQAEGHSEIDELLACSKSVDLIIPRGSNQFVQYIMNNTKIPVMGHADGICHTYIDGSADADKACKIIIDAKTQYTAACNSTETLLIDRNFGTDNLRKVAEALSDSNVKLRGNKEVSDILGCEQMGDDEYNTEYLDMIISVKLVNGVDEAVAHINNYGSHHTDCIITENMDNAEKFLNLVDSAGVYLNCSTRFADGFRYGFGAEVGISTSKIHARGPVGLEGLTTYKYKLYGNGHIVDDYSTGRKNFNFKDL
ncbi:MAG: glutamate-5-semialdehyde dehydrogenase [Oscillospiraceae bacterium]|nr:glutamate-5-semialdehyde dehydrogenase [Oscillospiraceae bacterium]